MCCATKDIDDKASIVEAIKATNLNTVVGHVTWKGGPVPNVAKTKLAGGAVGQGQEVQVRACRRQLETCARPEAVRPNSHRSSTDEARSSLPALLELHDVSKSFGSVHAVRSVSLSLEEGEALGVVGPNGAGKTTVLNLIGGSRTRRSRPDPFRGRDITRLPGHHHARLGIGRTFQIPRPFGGLTAYENVLVAITFGRSHAHRGSAGHLRRDSRAGGDRGQGERARRQRSLCSSGSGSRSHEPSLPGRGSCCSTKWRAG